MNEYLQKREQLQNMYRNQYGKSYPQIAKFIDIDRQATDALIDEVLLQRYLHKLELSVGEKQLEEFVAQNYFPQGITPEAYRMFLQRVGMSGPQFEQKLERQLVVNQLMNLIRDLNVISEAELQAAFNQEHAKFQFTTVAVRRQDFEKQVDLSNEAPVS